MFWSSFQQGAGFTLGAGVCFVLIVLVTQFGEFVIDCWRKKLTVSDVVRDAVEKSPEFEGISRTIEAMYGHAHNPVPTCSTCATPLGSPGDGPSECLGCLSERSVL